MVMQYFSNALNVGYKAVGYAATHPKETLATIGAVAVLGLAGCNGDVKPITTPTIGIEQPVSDLASKAIQLHNLVISKKPKWGVEYKDGYYGVVAEMIVDGIPYRVQVGNIENTGGKGYGATTIWHNSFGQFPFDTPNNGGPIKSIMTGSMITTDDRGLGSNSNGQLDGQVDVGSFEDQLFNPYINLRPELEDKLQAAHERSLDALIKFLKN